ncbi:MAG: hypothetical protein ACREX8_02020 [Gammaproteobacteria bacterium]
MSTRPLRCEHEHAAGRDDLAVLVPGLPHTDEIAPISNLARPPDACP